MTDSELIARVLVSNDHAAFGEIVRRHQSAVRHFLRHLTRGDHALADDLAQETFLQAYRSLARFHGGSTFATWLFGIAYNHWRNARRRRTGIALDEVPAASLPIEPAPDRQVDLKQDLAQALRQLPPDEQLALHLAYQQGLPHGEIADVTGWPVGTVKTHLLRGKAKLRSLLQSWNPAT